MAYLIAAIFPHFAKEHLNIIYGYFKGNFPCFLQLISNLMLAI